MPERWNIALRILCLALAGIVLFQLSRIVTRKDSLSDLRVEGTGLPVANSASTVETNVPAKIEPANTAPKTARTASAAAKKQADLPPLVQTKVDRITQSEILASIVRPLPMALLGIAGKDAFIRTPTGQSALLREGEESGGVKVLKVGVNRVLIEHEQQKKELTVFAGFGGESLLPKGEKAPGETTIK
jgi:hypothetical protein